MLNLKICTTIPFWMWSTVYTQQLNTPDGNNTAEVPFCRRRDLEFSNENNSCKSMIYQINPFYLRVSVPSFLCLFLQRDVALPWPAVEGWEVKGLVFAGMRKECLAYYIFARVAGSCIDFRREKQFCSSKHQLWRGAAFQIKVRCIETC